MERKEKLLIQLQIYHLYKIYEVYHIFFTSLSYSENYLNFLNDDTINKWIQIDEKRKIFKDKEIDITILKIKIKKNIYNCLEIEENLFNEF